MNNDFIEMIAGMAVMNIDNKLNSVIKGNRNWVIRKESYVCEDGSIWNHAYISKFGEMKRTGLFNERLKDICKHNIRWYYFTYKKDFLKAVKTLEENGYVVRWL